MMSSLLKKALGVASGRTLPKVKKVNFEAHLKKHQKSDRKYQGKVVLYLDEFTQFLDAEVGLDAIDVLEGLGYQVELYKAESGRAFISKGFLKQARSLAQSNFPQLYEFAKAGVPLVGIEPSALLTFRDEYARLGVPVDKASAIASNCFLIEEFISREHKHGRIGPESFTREARNLKIHVHCHQKALSNQKVTFEMLNIPIGYNPTLIAAGCCGMAGSFGYEKEHFELSMEIGQLRLFPSVKKAPESTVIVANGTSCRHQILDGTGRTALHPVSILKGALSI
jgi:Fe-S oxidoreductase